jgi:glycerol-3-phosphate dehydrogenase
VDDVLTRRTRISIEYPHRGVESAPAVAALMGEVLGWSSAQHATEVETYEARVAAERESQARFDDAAADAVRTSVPEVRTALVSPAAGSTSRLR